jgi:hypothetical protein
LVGWWPFNGNAIDESINTNDGTVNGATLTTDRFGNNNKAYSFNGTNNKIVVNDATPLRLNNTNFTISFWTYINAYSTSGGTAFIYKRGAPTLDGWGVAASQGAQNKMTFGVGGGADPRGYSNSTLGLSGWHNVTIVYTLTAHELKFYIDGLLDNTTNGIDGNNLPIVGGMPTPNASCTSVMYFGQDTRNNNYWLNGKLDDIGIWNRTLTQQEITNLYNSSSVGLNEFNNSKLFSVYPNPAKHQINIKVDGSLINSAYNIYDYTGKLILSGKLTSENTSIELTNLPQGIYMLSVGDNAKQTFKLVRD